MEELATVLKLPRKTCVTPIGGLNGSRIVTQSQVEATVESLRGGYRKTLEFLVVPTISTQTPDIQLPRSLLKVPPNLPLADPEFHKPASVQLLLSSGPTLATLCAGQIKLSGYKESDLVMQKTLFGWVIGGKIPIYPNELKGSRCLLNRTMVSDDLSRFWEMEDIEPQKHLSAEEVRCEEQFKRTIARDESGRFVAALPFNHQRQDLGESYFMALKRLTYLERRFVKNAEFKAQYGHAIKEYMTLGYLSKMPSRLENEYFIPHQAVFKKSSLTTKIRIVFEASAPSSTGISLNDALLGGPTIQDNIFSLLLRFRIHKYVLTGDIEKMYLQIRIQQQDQKFLRILWRDDDGEIGIYQFNRLIFGLKPASYIATRCIQQLAEEEESRFPGASQTLKRDLYVDDLLTGADSIAEVIKLQEETTQLLREGGFNLRQCASNAKEVLRAIPDRCVNLQLQKSDDTILKTLGVHWDSGSDRITYTVRPVARARITKRHIFSEVAKIYDPLGLLNPVIVIAKLIIQELWTAKVDWDESLPTALYTRWEAFVAGLNQLNNVSFDRRVIQSQNAHVELHGFCDASERAYGAWHLREICKRGW